VTRVLNGNIEDLGLDEIVRVIGLSRRSGALTVESFEGRAELTFDGGRLVRGRLQDEEQTCASLLVRVGVLDEDELFAPPGTPEASQTLEELIERVAEDREDPGLLVRVDEAILDALTELALRVMLYRAGTFAFRVFEEQEAPLRYPRDTALTLPAGIDADELVREAKRRRLEKKSDPFSTLPPSTAGAAAGLKRPSVATEHPELFLVDDDAAFLKAAERAALDAGVPVVALPGARQAVDRFFALGATDGNAVMVVDLVMPRTTGRGILGGLEILRRAAELDLAGRVFLALEGDHEDARNIARTLGAAGVVTKPKSDRIAHATRTDEPAFAGYLNPALERLRRTPLAAQSFDLARELRMELNETSGEWRTEGGKIIDENIRSLEVLKALLGELNNPSFEEEIPLLVLRFASAFFARGALFVVDKKKNELSGLGGFGLGVSDPGRLVHSIRIPLQADTVFSRALKEQAGVRQPFFESEHNARLVQTLGGPRPREVYTAPLISPRGVEAVLYADNATDQRPFADAHLLEIFLQQSAAALERANLARQLKRISAGMA
jgi:CheY-like chemotaxis protein